MERVFLLHYLLKRKMEEERTADKALRRVRSEVYSCMWYLRATLISLWGLSWV